MTQGALPASLLEGCRVLDLTDERGTFCSRVLADFGADVIVVEPPGGSPIRQRGPFYHDEVDPQKSLYWFYTNANKRGITLDLAKPEGRDLFLKLVDKADIVVESFPPGYLDRLGLGYQSLKARKPSLVMTAISPFGQEGPYRDYAADDLVLTAMGGMVRLYGYLDTEPFRMTAPQAYFLGSAHAAMASTLAFYHAELTGEGQYADVSIQEAIVLSLMVATEIWEMLKVSIRGTGPFFVSPRPAPQSPLLSRQIWRAKDGFVMLMLGGGAQAGSVASSRKIIELANADGYALEYADYAWEMQDAATITQEEIAQFSNALEPWISSKTKAELFAFAVEYGLLLAPANTAKDIAESPQLAARGFWAPVAHPELGTTIDYPGAPVKVEGAPWTIRKRPPLIGEHNQAIYEGELGLTAAQTASLRSSGVI